jgi:hypothetical protein
VFDGLVTRPGGAVVWELFERRYEAEHYLSPLVRAQRLVGRLAEAPAEGSSALRAELDRLTFFDLRAFYNRAVELTGGPTGQDEIPADAGYLLSHQAILLVLRAVSGAAVRDATKARQDQLAAQDLAAVEECKPIDDRVASAVRAIVADQATDEDADRLAAAAREYQDILSRAPLSAGGRRLLRYKIANALDNLGRACESLHRDAEAQVHFGTAAAIYAEAGERNQAAASISKRDAAGQRLLPDADVRLEQLLAELRTAPERSVDRATVLIGLTELAHGNSDDFEARRWLGDAISELAVAGYDLPVPDGTDAAVEGWIREIPPGDEEDPSHFLRQLAAVLEVHSRVAAARVALEPAAATAAEAQLYRLAGIILEMPAHTRAVDVRLGTQLGQAPSRDGDILDDTGAEYMAVMDIINKLLDLTEHSTAGTPQVIAQWQQMADDCIARARVLGQPITLAQALEAGARVKMAAGEPEAAIGLLEEEYEQASRVGGKLATDQMIIAMSNVAKAQLGLGLARVNEASEAAGKVIGLIERDRYRVSAPFQQAALLAPHADVFAIGVFSAWKSGDYDTMLQRMELSKARASVRQFFLSGTRDSTEIDQELSVLNDAIHGQGGETQQTLRQERLQLWDRRAIARLCWSRTKRCSTTTGYGR